jgi:hypothetical protein
VRQRVLSARAAAGLLCVWALVRGLTLAPAARPVASAVVIMSAQALSPASVYAAMRGPTIIRSLFDVGSQLEEVYAAHPRGLHAVPKS